jgi:hypothetical protein
LTRQKTDQMKRRRAGSASLEDKPRPGDDIGEPFGSLHLRFTRENRSKGQFPTRFATIKEEPNPIGTVRFATVAAAARIPTLPELLGESPRLHLHQVLGNRGIHAVPTRAFPVKTQVKLHPEPVNESNRVLG